LPQDPAPPTRPHGASVAISAITLFVEDLARTRAFYERAFDVQVVYEDEVSVVLRLDNLLLNLLSVTEAHELVGPDAVGSTEAGARCQFSIWVDNVDAWCADLRQRGVEFTDDPEDRPWGRRVANFVDPAGHQWELAQEIGA
jgi:catechol 2,3-dioxygenase-like lactoylglutathione lyase family enzyme